jgi:hypothetical protein
MRSVKKFLCRVFGHKMYFDSCNVAGPSTCKRCQHKKAGIVWPRTPPFKDAKRSLRDA